VKVIILQSMMISTTKAGHPHASLDEKVKVIILQNMMVKHQ